MDHLKILKALIESQGNLSVQELEAMIKEYEAQINLMPVPEFCGLSPSQMERILYSRLTQIDDIVKIKDSFDPSLLAQVVAAKRASLFIQMIGDAKEVKMTQRGFLPKKIVTPLKQICIKGDELYAFPVVSEQNELDILTLRHMIASCGWTKIRNGRISLTRIGKDIYQHGFGSKEYVALLRQWMAHFDWARLDNYGHGGLGILQASVVFSLYCMHMFEKESFTTQEMARILLTAFPKVLDDESLKYRVIIPPEETFNNVVSIRLLKRFALYFGLLDPLPVNPPDPNEDKKTALLLRSSASETYRTTKLFDEVFSWVEQKTPVFPANCPEGVMVH